MQKSKEIFLIYISFPSFSTKKKEKKKKRIFFFCKKVLMSHHEWLSLLFCSFPHKRVRHIPCYFAAFHKSAEHTFCFYSLHNETAWFCHTRRHQAEYQPCVTGLFSAEYREKMGGFRVTLAPAQTKIADEIGTNVLLHTYFHRSGTFCSRSLSRPARNSGLDPTKQNPINPRCLFVIKSYF